MVLAKAMPVNTIAAFINEIDTRLRHILHHYMGKARETADHSQVTHVGMDETSRSRSHDYVSLLTDLQTPRVLFATDGKGASMVERGMRPSRKVHGYSKRQQAGSGTKDEFNQDVCIDFQKQGLS